MLERVKQVVTERKMALLVTLPALRTQSAGTPYPSRLQRACPLS